MTSQPKLNKLTALSHFTHAETILSSRRLKALSAELLSFKSSSLKIQIQLRLPWVQVTEADHTDIAPITQIVSVDCLRLHNTPTSTLTVQQTLIGLVLQWDLPKLIQIRTDFETRTKSLLQFLLSGHGKKLRHFHYNPLREYGTASHAAVIIATLAPNLTSLQTNFPSLNVHNIQEFKNLHTLELVTPWLLPRRFHHDHEELQVLTSISNKALFPLLAKVIFHENSTDKSSCFAYGCNFRTQQNLLNIQHNLRLNGVTVFDTNGAEMRFVIPVFGD